MTALYVPPTDEADHKKQNQSLQLIGGVTSTNTDNITTNTANIATNTTNIATNSSAITALQALLAKVTNSLSGDVALNNTGTYFDGPSVAQGTTGTWLATGTVTLADTAGAANFVCKLWDGTTIIAASETNISATASGVSLSLSGYLASPAANIRISCRDLTSTSGKILFNQGGASKDSTLSAIRIA